MYVIWLKNDVEKRLAALKEQGLLGDVEVKTHSNSGKKYLNIYEDVFDPTMDALNIPEELIEKVTLRDRIYRGFRMEGIYRNEGATLMVKTEGRTRSDMMGNYIEHEEWQDISVAAPNLEKLRIIYTLVRQNKLSPEENWDDVQKFPLSAGAPTETETKTIA
ncbi:MAG: hypothetical protein A3H02_00840 [Candidatus Niyogibacteria bacterium RIFCSPLOWO2_12_FULL_41_13]|uniref:Uncharacterized protein n=1 Tax=Candidatus Niyogibacteria bacterium RIFCSPLOWO2_12_FULL_41_13 TaxID=1801726 RepID=A0A1G2F2F9_9BACT|nr:MAG: hypothetical protein A3H02_00840 [Candidatus Niyogibacteria bacterium RIFCSPLOWO2_12_FULL_41_13]